MPEQTARVGIVIRTKDRPLLLARALQDIAAQSFQDWQAVVVDDGGDALATDAVIARHETALAGRVRVIHHAQPIGRSGAANAGVRALQTDLVVLHDDDDLWHSSFLEASVAWMDANPEAAGVVTRTEIVFERVEGERITELGRTPFWGDMTGISYADMLQVNRFVPIAYLYRRVVHDDVGYYREDIHAAEDWEFNLRVLSRWSIGFLGDQVRAFWMQRRDQDGALGNSMFLLAEEHENYDRLIRDDALRRYTAEHGDGLVLYLARYIHDEVARQLDERMSLAQRATGIVRAGWRRLRGR